MSETKKLNPLIVLAAVSVTLFSLLGIAAITGVLPTSFSKSSESALQNETASTASPKSDSKTASAPAKPAAKTESANKVASAPAPATAAREPAKAAPVCNNCGVVSEVRAIKQKGEGSGLGAIAGGVVGGLLGNQVGGGSGQKIATVAGAAGGAYAGHQIEKNVKSTTRYDVIVNMDDGSVRSFAYDSQPAFQAGAKVKVVNGALTAG
ncbi:MAG: glycine zipper 2TM domain-containing protein [Burkholderiales bacterium]|nr:glycine zipper 2TM domain-containing protein [Burkholderiales bacterium]